MFFWIPKLRPSPKGTQDQGGEEVYRGLKFPKCVGLWEEILSTNKKQRRFGMCLNRVNFFFLEKYKEEATVSRKLWNRRVRKCSGEESKRTFCNTVPSVQSQDHFCFSSVMRGGCAPLCREVNLKPVARTELIRFWYFGPHSFLNLLHCNYSLSLSWYIGLTFLSSFTFPHKLAFCPDTKKQRISIFASPPT